MDSFKCFQEKLEEGRERSQKRSPAEAFSEKNGTRVELFGGVGDFWTAESGGAGQRKHTGKDVPELKRGGQRKGQAANTRTLLYLAQVWVVFLALHQLVPLLSLEKNLLWSTRVQIWEAELQQRAAFFGCVIVSRKRVREESGIAITLCMAQF